jgi:hypothetical protein
MSLREPLPIPPDWKYGVRRLPPSYPPYCEHVLTDPSGQEHIIWTNELDFYSDTAGYLDGIHQWVEDTTSGTSQPDSK